MAAKRVVGPVMLPPPERNVVVLCVLDGRDNSSEASQLVQIDPVTADMLQEIQNVQQVETSPTVAAKILLDRLATGYDLRGALAEAASFNAATRPRRVSPTRVKRLTQEEEKRQALLEDDEIHVFEPRPAPTPLPPGAPETAVTAAPANSVAPTPKNALRTLAPRLGDTRITAAKTMTSTFLRQTFAKQVVMLHGKPKSQLEDMVHQLIRDASSDAVSRGSTPLLTHEENNDPADLYKWFSQSVLPHSQTVWDGEDAVIVLTGPAPTHRMANTLFPVPAVGTVATVLGELSKSHTPSAPRSHTTSSSTSAGGPTTASAKVRRVISRAMSPGAPLEGRYSPPRSSSPTAAGGGNRQTQSLAVTDDFNVLEALLVEMLREGRARSITPSYEVRIWVSCLRCLSSEQDGKFEDVFATSDRCVLSDSIGSGTPTPASRAAEVEERNAAKAPTQPSQATAATSAPPPAQPAVDLPPKAPTDPPPRISVVPSPSGNAAVVATNLKLFPVHTKKDAEIVAKRLAKFASPDHHLMLTITVQQDCPMLPIPARKASVRFFVVASALESQSSTSIARRGHFTKDELNLVLQRMVRTPTRPQGMEPPTMALYPLMPTTRFSPRCTSFLDLLATSINHTTVAHLLCCLCISKRSIGAYMPFLAMVSGYALTTSIGDVNGGVLDILDELIEEQTAFEERIEALKDEIHVLEHRGRRRQSAITSVSSENERIAQEAYATSMRLNTDTGNADDIDDDDDGDVLLDDVAMVTSNVFLPKPPNPARPSSSRLSVKISEETRPQSAALSHHTVTPALTTATSGPKLTKEALRLTQGLRSLNAEDEFDDDDVSDHGEIVRTASRQLSEMTAKRQNQAEIAALTERHNARHHVANLREKIERTKQEIIRRKNEHEYNMRERDAIHQRELAQYDPEALRRRIDRNGADLGFETVEPTLVRNAAMEAKAKRSADRVRAEAFRTVEECNSVAVARKQKAVDDAIRELATLYASVVSLTTAPPRLHVSDALRRECEQRILRGDVEPSPVLDKRSVAVLRENQQRLGRLFELANNMHDAAEVYRQLHPTIAAMWRRGEFCPSETRRQRAAIEEVDPLSALKANLKSSSSWIKSVLNRTNEWFKANRDEAWTAQQRAMQIFPAAEAAMDVPIKRSLLDAGLPHPRYVTFCCPAQAVSVMSGETKVDAESVPTSTSSKRPIVPKLPTAKSASVSSAASTPRGSASSVRQLQQQQQPRSARSSVTPRPSSAAFLAANRIVIKSAHREETTPFTPREYEASSRVFEHRKQS